MAKEILTILLMCLVGFMYTSAHSTRYPGTTISYHTHSESAQIKFAYESVLHQLIAITASTCYLAPLTHDERGHVHSSTGLADLEDKMMRDWIGKLPEVRIHHDGIHLPVETRKWCASRDIFLLERNLHVMTSPKAMLD